MSSPLWAIERFYGQELSPDLISAVRHTPLNQLGDLAETIDERSYVPASRQVSGIAADQLIVRRDFSEPLANLDILRSMLVYSEVTFVADPIRNWASEAFEFQWPPRDIPVVNRSAGVSLARILQGLLPVLPLIRQGILQLIPDPQISLHISYGSASGPLLDETDLLYDDPIIARGVVAACRLSIDDIEDWGLVDSDGEIFYREVAERILEDNLYGSGSAGFRDKVLRCIGASGNLDAYWDSAQRAQILRNALESLGGTTPIVPLATDKILERHLFLNSATTGISTSLGSPRAVTQSESTAIRFGIPSMNTIDLAKLVSLRQNEEVFAQFRSSLETVLDGVANEHTSSYSEFVDAISASAESHLGPIVERLTREIERGRLAKSVLSGIAGKAVSLGISGSMKLASPHIPSGLVGNPIGERVKRRTGRRISPNLDDQNIVRSALLSLIHTGQ